MTDPIDHYIERYRFNEDFIQDEEKCKELVLRIYNLWEVFTGSHNRPTQDIIRIFLKQLLSLTNNHEWIIMERDRETANRVIERVAQIISDIGHRTAERDRSIQYIS